MARDWLKDLWKASYKGASFWTERDQESGGRRIVKHQFPMRDDPFLEDLGEDLREFELTAYLASDRADGEAAALAAACASRGAGILVMPVQGPVLVRCVSFSRDSSKDRGGYIGFTLKCCREGAAFALISTAMSANLVFVAAESTAAAIAGSFAANMASLVQPSSAADFVVTDAVNAAQDVVSTLEAVRASETVGPVASAVQRNEIEAIFGLVANLIVTPSPVAAVTLEARSVPVADPNAASGPAVLAARIVAVARALGDAMAPASAAHAFEAVLSEPAFASVIVAGAVYATPNRKAMALNAEQLFRLLRLAAITAYCEAVARMQLQDRPAGITLRANVAEYFEAELGDLPASEIDLSHQVGALRDATIAYLSRVILDLAPVIRLEANLSMPSIFWAYRIYQDPQRSVDLVARNRVVHPSFMPTAFEALAK